MKYRSTDYASKNLEFFSNDYFKDRLSIDKKSVNWERDVGRYIIRQLITVYIKCKSNYTMSILDDLERLGFNIENYGNDFIIITHSFLDTIIGEWNFTQIYINEYVSNNTMQVHNKCRGLKQKYIKEILYYEIQSNNINIQLTDRIKKDQTSLR